MRGYYDLKKRLLIICDPPAPPGYFPRLRYLCEHLAQKDYDVTLLTEDYMPLNFAHSYPIVSIRMYRGGFLDWFLKSLWTLLTDWYNRSLAARFLESESCGRYDVVICTTFNDVPLGAAQRIAKALNVPLICDIRDLEEQVDNSRYQYSHKQWWLMPFRRLYRAIHSCRRNAVLRKANAITTVSPWHADFIKAIVGANVPITTMYNGYNDTIFYPESTRTPHFVVSYIGSLSDWQKPGLKKVECAINELNREHPNNPILLDIHTPKQHPIAHEKMGDALRQSSVVLVLTAQHTHGMLTTKFYEALGCEKPVLCVPSDHGSLAELIEYTNAGIAADDIEDIKAFILAQYAEWQKNGYTHQPTQHREEFSREFQSAKMEQIIQSL